MDGPVRESGRLLPAGAGGSSVTWCDMLCKLLLADGRSTARLDPGRQAGRDRTRGTSMPPDPEPDQGSLGRDSAGRPGYHCYHWKTRLDDCSPGKSAGTSCVTFPVAAHSVPR